MDIQEEFNSDLFSQNQLFLNEEETDFTHLSIPVKEDSNSPTAETKNTVSEEEKNNRIQELEGLIQRKQRILSANRTLQEQLYQQLLVVESLLVDSQKVANQPVLMADGNLNESSSELDEEAKKKAETRQLLQSFPIRNSSLYFSKRKKSYPRYTSLDGIPLTFSDSASQVHTQYWSEKDDQALSSWVMSFCREQVEAGNVPNSIRSSVNTYNTTSDSLQKARIFHSILPTLLHQFSWESISHDLHHSVTDCFVHWLNVCDPYINKTSWTLQEDSKLNELVLQFGETNWLEIAKELNTGRTPYQCFERFVNVLEMTNYNVKWTERDDQLLKEGIQKYGKKSWKQVALMVPNRTWNQCRSRYFQCLLQESKKGHWSSLEDARFLLLLFFYGASDWKRISTQMYTRKPAQCRDHWINVLNPDVLKAAWTKADDMKLLKLTRNKSPIVWKAICKHFPGRTADACKTRYHSLVKG